jgi:hypothetical protein
MKLGQKMILKTESLIMNAGPTTSLNLFVIEMEQKYGHRF